MESDYSGRSVLLPAQLFPSVQSSDEGHTIRVSTCFPFTHKRKRSCFIRLSMKPMTEFRFKRNKNQWGTASSEWILGSFLSAPKRRHCEDFFLFVFNFIDDGNMNIWSPSCLRKMAWSLRASQGRRKVGFRVLSFLHLGGWKKRTLQCSWHRVVWPNSHG